MEAYYRQHMNKAQQSVYHAMKAGFTALAPAFPGSPVQGESLAGVVIINRLRHTGRMLAHMGLSECITQRTGRMQVAPFHEHLAHQPVRKRRVNTVAPEMAHPQMNGRPPQVPGQRSCPLRSHHRFYASCRNRPASRPVEKAICRL